MPEERDLLIAYVRQSRARPGEDEETSLSLGQQERALTEWGRAQGFARIVVVKDHDETGRTMQRPGFRDLTARAAAHPGATIAVYKYDRFARNLIGQELAVEELERLGVAVRSVTEPPGKLPRQLLGSIAEYYSDQLSERLIAIRASAAQAGRYLAARPAYGYRRAHAEEVADPRTGGVRVRRSGPIEPDPDAAPIVRELFARAAAGEALYALCRDLTARGVPGPRGGPWQVFLVRGILTNPAYRGVVRHKGAEVARGAWPAIVDDEPWLTVQRRLARTHRPRPKADLASWCEGRVRHACGSPMYLLPIKRHPRRDGTVPPPAPTFVCRRSAAADRCGLPHLSVLAATVEAAARRCLVADLGPARIATLEQATRRAEAAVGGADVLRARARLERARIQADRRREKARELFLAGDDDRARWEAEKARHAAEVARIVAELAVLPAAPDPDRYRRVAAELAGFGAALAEASDAALGAVLAAVGEVVVGPEGIAIAYAAPIADFVPRPMRVGF